MKLELPGQLRGPECRSVIKQAIALRSRLSPWIETIADERIDKFVIVLRVDGSLGSFGTAGTENVRIESRALQCDLVLADYGWGDLSDQQIGKVLRAQVLSAVEQCFDEYRILYDRNALRTVIETDH